ncbi:MAG: hypothetical protein LBQ12_14080 [Deltaproteobacteria bacterium]|jgi:hypothetical protein|nr:hypothetical protein [Deltaproteobacteria bacterium]
MVLDKSVRLYTINTPRRVAIMLRTVPEEHFGHCEPVVRRNRYDGRRFRCRGYSRCLPVSRSRSLGEGNPELTADFILLAFGGRVKSLFQRGHQVQSPDAERSLNSNGILSDMELALLVRSRYHGNQTAESLSSSPGARKRLLLLERDGDRTSERRVGAGRQAAGRPAGILFGSLFIRVDGTE